MQLPRSFAARRERSQQPNLHRDLGAQHEDHPKVALAALAGLALAASPAAAQKITFTLNWVAGGDHAPYFYAQKMGWYKQAGLDIDFETGRGSAASAQKVGAGSVAARPVRHGAACCCSAARAPTGRLMNVYANSPQGFYWLKSSGITGVKDLAGKKIGNPGRRRRAHHVAGAGEEGRHRSRLR